MTSAPLHACQYRPAVAKCGARAAQVRPVDVATLAEEKARAAVQAELSMFEADRTVRKDGC